MEIEFLSPDAVTTQKQLTLMKCIDFFEGGAENIYLVDEAGRYVWTAIQRGPLHDNGHGGWTLRTAALPPVVFCQPWEEQNLPAARTTCQQMFAQNPAIAELPVVNSGGQSSLLHGQNRRNRQRCLNGGGWMRISMASRSCRKARFIFLR